MQPIISVRHSIHISERTKEHIEKACAKLSHFYDRIIDCEVVVEKKRLQTSVEFIIKVPQQTLVASASTADENLFKAMDEAYEKIEAQLKKYRDKQMEHRP
ncbi:MAG: ribosome-associated translation inhibitor RaiA [Candidatus Handelsmanbacteria bacterium]|nr:ribosome-associated translation inhibitor RaiA [Candidatus Handelsmanbacteria bacterium]